MKSVKEQIEIIKCGTVSIINPEELEQKLSYSIKTNTPLRVKLGVDPTAPDIHLGHTVVLRKMRQFQDLGHQAVLIIGDFTALIGDPTGNSKTRPQLTEKEVDANAKTYLEQVGKILDLEKLELRKNSEWLKKLSLLDIINIASKITIANLIERDDFSKRYKEGKSISLHEFLYPVMQAYDSVMVKANIELGATDQTFNILLGRDLQRTSNQEPQVCVTLPLLVGISGKEKMSKSLGNYVGINENSFEMYSKIMSIPDSIMKDYFTLLTDIDIKDLEDLLDPQKTHPMEAKKELARRITSFYYPNEIENVDNRWKRIFSEKQEPTEKEDTEYITVKPDELDEKGDIWLVDVMRKALKDISGNDARRLIQQGAIEIDGKKVRDINYHFNCRESRSPVVLKIGKKNRFFTVKFEPRYNNYK